MITLQHDGSTYTNWNFEDLLNAGVPNSEIGAALKAAAKGKVAEFAESARQQLATQSAGKIVEWKIKAEIALDKSNADPEELDLVERGAAARGLTIDQEIAAITTKNSAYRKIALLIGVLEDETNAAIAAIPDDSENIESLILATLDEAKQQAAVAFSEAQGQV